MTSTASPYPSSTGLSDPGPRSLVVRSSRRRWLWRVGGGLFVLLCLAIAVGAPLPYFVFSLQDLADADQGLAAHYVDQPRAIRAALLVHAGFAGLALALTPLQWSGRVRRRWVGVHRWGGRLSAVAIGIGAASGLVVAQVSYAGLVGRLGFSTLSVLWAFFTVRAITEARRGRLAQHRRWALRVMALTFAAVTLRLWLVLWIGVSMPQSADEASRAFEQMYALTPFLSWVPNLVVIEWWMRRRATRLL